MRQRRTRSFGRLLAGPFALLLALHLTPLGVPGTLRAQAQEREQVQIPAQLSVEIDLDIWGIDEPGDIRMGRLSVVHESPDRLVVHILSTEEPAGGGDSEIQIESSSAPSARHNSGREEKALWVWNTEELLASRAARARFLSFTRELAFDVIFLQLPGFLRVEMDERRSGRQAKRLRKLLQELHRSGIRTYALDGHKKYATAGWHPAVVASVQRVGRFNRASRPGSRFVGIRFDIEPYLLDGYGGPRTEEILEEFVELVEELSAVSSAQGLRLGLDIPFWFDEPEELTGRIPTVEMDGEPAPVAYRLLDLVDDVAIMDYRTFVHGGNGLLAHAVGELAYAAEHGKKVYVGLETHPLPDETYVTFRGVPSTRCDASPDGSWVIEFEPTANRAGRFRLVRQTTREKNPATLCWRQTRPVLIDSGRISFAGAPVSRLLEFMREAREELSRSPAFAGFAIHHYSSLEKMYAGYDNGGE